MTGNSNEITITIRAKDDGTIEVVSGKMRALGGATGALGPETARASNAMRTLQSAMVGLGGAAVALAGTAGLGALVFALNNSIKAASDLQEAANKFDVVFKGQEQAAARWAMTLVDSYAMSTREAKQYLSSLQDLLVPMGMVKEQAGDLSFQIVKLAADLGSFNNLQTADVIRDIQSALVGQYETVRKYGASLDAATVQQVALNMGLAKSKEELTAADKAHAAFQLILQSNEAALGDMVRTADSYANQVKKLNAQIEDFKATLGSELLPIVTDYVAQINAWVQANGELLAQDIAGWITETHDALKPMVEIILQHPEVVEYGLIGLLIGGKKGLLYGVGAGIGKEVVDSVNDFIEETAPELEAKYRPFFYRIGKAIEEFTQRGWTAAEKAAYKAARETEAATDKMKGDVYDYAAELKRLTEGEVEPTVTKTITKVVAASTGANDKIRSAEERMAKEILRLHSDTFDGQVALLDAARDAYEQLGVDKEKLARWYDEKFTALVEEQTEKDKEEYAKRLKEAEEYWARVAELGDEATGAYLEQQIRMWEGRDRAAGEANSRWIDDEKKTQTELTISYEDTYNAVVDIALDALDTIGGKGQDLEDLQENLLDRLRGYFIKTVGEIVLCWALGCREMAQTSAATQLLMQMPVLGGGGGGGGILSSLLNGGGGGGGLFNWGRFSPFGTTAAGTVPSYLLANPFSAAGGAYGTSTLSGGIYGPDYLTNPTGYSGGTAASWTGWNSMGAGVLTFLTQGLMSGNWGRAAISGVGTGLGSYGGAALGSALGMSGNLIFPIVGGIVGGLLGNLVGGLFGKDHTYRRQRRGTQWEQALSEFSTAEDWESMIDTATYGTEAIYLGGREWQAAHPGQFRPFTAGNERTGAYSDWDAGVKIQHAGYEWTDLKDAMTYEDYDKTISWWDDIAAAALNSLDDQKEATVATARELANYKDKIELTKELMGGWKEAGQEVAQEMLQMYENMRRMTIEDLTEKFAAGTIKIEEFTEALQDLELTPMERATTLASAALQGLLDTAELGSAQMYNLYEIYQQNAVAAAQLTDASNDLAQVQALITSGADLTEEELTTLINYYRLLKQVLDGTIESMTDFAAAQAAASAILDRDAIAALQQYQMALKGASDNEIQQAVWAKRYQFGSMQTGVLGLGSPENMVEWFKIASYDELKAYAQMFGVTVDTLIADIVAMDASIKDSAAAAAAHAAALADTADRLAQSRAKILGASETDVSWLAISQRWGWDETGGRTEQQIREGIEWYLHGASAEDIYNLATSKGMSVEQFIADIEWMAEQMGYFSSAVEDATASIQDLEQAAQSWKGVSQSLTEQIRGITFSESNPQTAVQRMGLVYQTIQGLTGGRSIEAYLGGISDVGERQDAVQELSDLWGEYLQLAQEAYQRPSNEYQRQYDLTLQNLEALKDYSLSEYDVALKQLQALEQIVANTSPEVETPAGGDGAAAGGSVDKYGRITYGTIGGERYAVNVMGGPGIDSRYAPDLPLPEHYHWQYNYSASGGVPFWYAMADAPQYALPQFDRGIDYVPYDMPAYIHHSEAVLNPMQADVWRRGYRQPQISLSLAANITVNGADKTDQELGRLIESKMTSFLRYEGGKMIEEIMKHSGVRLG